MSNTKNFGLIGVGSDVQYGKAGGRVIFDDGEFLIRNAANNGYLNLKVATPTEDQDAVTKAYVDAFQQGLQVKESVRVATTGDVGGSYNASGGPANTGQLIGASGSIDGITLNQGDRILVKNQGTGAQNGIYVVTALTTVWNRAGDFDGTPANEVRGGAFVFVEAGTTNINTGWVLQGSGNLTLNTDAIVWVKFSTQGVLGAETNGGLIKTGSNFAIDWNNLVSETAVVDEDLFAFYDDSATGHRRVTAAALKSYMVAGTSTTTIEDGNSSVAVSDPGTGIITVTADATTVATFAVAGINLSADTTVTTGNSLSIVDLGTDRIVFTTTGGELISSSNLTFDDTDLGITAAVTVDGSLDVDNVSVDGNKISATNTNGDLTLQANGTGSVVILDGSDIEVAVFGSVADAVNGLVFVSGSTGNAPTIEVDGTDTNISIGFAIKGTGVLRIVPDTGNYEDNISNDNDIPNKKYVDDLLSNVSVSGGIGSVTGTVNLASAGAQNIGPAGGIPDGATIMRVYLDVTTASDAATTVTVGDVTNGANAYMTVGENDPEQASLYVAYLRLQNTGAARQAQATVATPGTVGSATCIIEFRYGS